MDKMQIHWQTSFRCFKQLKHLRAQKITPPLSSLTYTSWVRSFRRSQRVNQSTLAGLPGLTCSRLFYELSFATLEYWKKDTYCHPMATPGVHHLTELPTGRTLELQSGLLRLGRRVAAGKCPLATRTQIGIY